MTTQLYSPAEVIMIDLDDIRLTVGRKFGATQTVNSADGNAVEKVMQLTNSRGVDVAIEAVGMPPHLRHLSDPRDCGGWWHYRQRGRSRQEPFSSIWKNSGTETSR